LAEELADRAEVLAVSAGHMLITQGADDNDIYFILAGTFDVVVNGSRVAGRRAGDHVGEMAAVQPAQRRSASVTALEDAIVAKVSQDAFSNLGSRHPQLYRHKSAARKPPHPSRSSRRRKRAPRIWGSTRGEKRALGFVRRAKMVT
jgi:CRP-like cAMP-binding protein